MSDEQKAEGPACSTDEGERDIYHPDAVHERLTVFLVLAAVMMLLTILAYVFEEELFDLTYSHEAFIVSITMGVLLALFFLLCYRVPRIGLRLLGRGVELGQPRDDNDSSSTFNVYKSESGTEEKLHHSRRKQSRHLRRKLARNTPDNKLEASKNEE